MSKRGIEVTNADVHYEDVPKSTTGQVLGSVGATGDLLKRIIIVPETTAAETVAVLDGNVSRNVFITGTLADLTPIQLDFETRSVNGAWSITTGDHVHVIAIGSFT